VPEWAPAPPPPRWFAGRRPDSPKNGKGSTGSSGGFARCFSQSSLRARTGHTQGVGRFRFFCGVFVGGLGFWAPTPGRGFSSSAFGEVRGGRTGPLSQRCALGWLKGAKTRRGGAAISGPGAGAQNIPANHFLNRGAGGTKSLPRHPPGLPGWKQGPRRCALLESRGRWDWSRVGKLKNEQGKRKEGGGKKRFPGP